MQATGKRALRLAELPAGSGQLDEPSPSYGPANEAGDSMADLRLADSARLMKPSASLRIRVNTGGREAPARLAALLASGQVDEL